MQHQSDEFEIRGLLQHWAAAVRRHDLPAIMAHHDPGIVMFDLPPPLQCKGVDEYEKTWDLFFPNHEPGTAFDFRELDITSGADVAFATAIVRCGSGTPEHPSDDEGFAFRLTVGLRKIDGDWRITHEHHSLPTAA